MYLLTLPTNSRHSFVASKKGATGKLLTMAHGIIRRV